MKQLLQVGLVGFVGSVARYYPGSLVFHHAVESFFSHEGVASHRAVVDIFSERGIYSASMSLVPGPLICSKRISGSRGEAD